MATPNSLLRNIGCPQCSKRFGTSFSEQALYFYIKKSFPDAINQYQEGFGPSELDIYIPSKRIGIEYDGGKWHQNTIDKEKKKYKLCAQNGIFLIRVREDILETSEIICDHIIKTKYNGVNIVDLNDAIKETLQYLNVKSIDIDVDRDRLLIEEQYLGEMKERSLQNNYPEIAIEWDDEKNGNIKPNMILPKSNKKYWWKCQKCGYEWEATVANRTHNSAGCPKCAGTMQKDNETFISQLAEINPNVKPLEEYKNSDTKIKCRCLVCGKEWKVKPSKLLIGRGCPNCAVEKQKKNYRKGKVLEKGSICENAELMKEWDYDRNKDIEPSLLTYGSSVKVYWKCKKCGYKWKASIYVRATKGHGCPKCGGTQKKTDEEFRSELQTINPLIVPLEEYENSTTKILCECKKCNYRWKVTPSGLLKGHGCPNCAKIKSKRTTQQFQEELQVINPNIKIMSEYKRVDKHIKCKCLLCGHEWETIPKTLLSGALCPNCSKPNRMKTTKEFIDEMNKAHPDIVILSDYLGANKPIKCKCRKCGRIWEANAHDLMRSKHKCK